MSNVRMRKDKTLKNCTSCFDYTLEGRVVGFMLVAVKRLDRGERPVDAASSVCEVTNTVSEAASQQPTQTIYQPRVSTTQEIRQYHAVL